MGVKIIIAEACAVPTEDGPQHLDVNETVDVDKDTARELAKLGRALYLDKFDDPSKGTYTATADDKAKLKKLAASIDAEREARAVAAAVTTPAGLAALVAQQVQAALAAAAPKPAAQ